MSTRSRLGGDSSPDDLSADTTTVTACESCPGRVVFLESGNTDGWIATDHVVVPEE